jgi:hypothetical protein
MGKYALLLKQIIKECPELEPDYQDLKNAEEMVKFQLRHGNDLLAMDSLKECDVSFKSFLGENWVVVFVEICSSTLPWVIILDFCCLLMLSSNFEQNMEETLFG